jgi:hypothetical protein
MALGDSYTIPLASVPGTSGKRQILLAGRVVFTTSGAIDTTNSDTPGVTPTKPTGTGLYLLTFPACAKAYGVVMYYDASGGDTVATGKTCVATTGLLHFTVTEDDTIADATSGDYLDYIIVGES